jgi:hypothetical protein
MFMIAKSGSQKIGYPKYPAKKAKAAQANNAETNDAGGLFSFAITRLISVSGFGGRLLLGGPLLRFGFTVHPVGRLGRRHESGHRWAF